MHYLFQVLGPDYPLAEDRGELEYKALVRFNEACPGCVPKPIAYHTKNRACKHCVQIRIFTL